MTIPLDYEILRLIWWLFLGVLLIGFAIMGGYDLGVAMILPYVARNDAERRVTINAIGPFWEGNQVWLILGAGAVFAVGGAGWFSCTAAICNASSATERTST